MCIINLCLSRKINIIDVELYEHARTSTTQGGGSGRYPILSGNASWAKKLDWDVGFSSVQTEGMHGVYARVYSGGPN